MFSNLLIGIDIGSSSLKALAIDAQSGRVAALARQGLPYQRLPRGGCEVSAEAIHAAVEQVLRAVAQQLGPQAKAVRALACTGHGAGLYALDAQRQLVYGRAIASTDQRAELHARALAERHGAMLFDEVGCAPWAGQPMVLAAELLGTDAVQRGTVDRILFAKDYLGLWLTGELATDASDASTAGLLSLAGGDWSARAFAASGLAGLAPRNFAPLVARGEVFGRLLPARAEAIGLPAGLPVAMGAIDLLAAMTAVCADARDRAVSVMGTWCVNAVTGPVREPKPPVAAIVNFGPGEKRLYMENSPSSMANIAWATGALGFGDAQSLLDAAMSAPLGARGLRFLPFVNGGGPKFGTAGFVGLQSHHTREYMARAVVDAVAALHARHLGRLAACDLDVSALTVLGGGATDTRLVQLLAGFLGRPVQRCADDETGARGAALYAAFSQRLAAPGDAASPLLAPCDTVEPEAGEAQAHADFLAGFNDLIDRAATAVPTFQ